MTAIAQAQTAPRKIIRIGKTRLNLYLDLLLVLAFVVDMEEHFTGLQIHELLGVFIGAAIIIHLILHWNWILNVTRTFFKKLVHESRLNYLLNIALFADVATMIVTGILISRTLGLDLSAVQESSRTLEQLHRLTADLSLLIVALHVALHWKWIVTHASKYLLPARRAAH